MPVALQPMNTGQVLDRTFNLFRNNFLLFAGIAMLPALTLIAGLLLLIPIGLALPTSRVDFRDPTAMVVFFGSYGVILGLLYLIGYALALGATVYGVSQVHLGKPTSIGECYKKVMPSFWRVIGIVICLFLMMIGAMILSEIVIVVLTLALAPMFAAAGGSPVVAAIVGGIFFGAIFVAAIVWVLRIYCRYSLSVAACLVEKQGVVNSMKRSKFLAKGALWRIFIVFLLMFVFGLALSVAGQLSGTAITAVAGVIIGAVWQFGVSFIVSIVTFPIGTIAIALLYYDQRVRKEAFDLQLMMQSLGEAGAGQATAAMPIG